MVTQGKEEHINRGNTLKSPKLSAHSQKIERRCDIGWPL